MTNFEKIKTMSFHEMLEFMDRMANCEICSRRGCSDCSDVENCKPYIKEWLDSEVKESDVSEVNEENGR